MMAGSRPWLERLRQAFGIARHEAPPQEDSALRVYLQVQREDGTHSDRYLVGTLSSEAGTWTFRYHPDYASRPERPPISAFPDKATVYRSADLWPFFAVRLPPLEREDVRRVVKERGLENMDELHLLGFLSRKAITSPYEFELVPEAA